MASKNIIAAFDKNHVIGHEGDMPWRGELPADLRHFKETTQGSTIVMGRKTIESIGKPLPNRRNIVITTQEELPYDEIEIVNSLEEAFGVVDDEELYIIGGEAIYRLAMPIIDKLIVTEIAAEFPGDTYFPEIDPGEWREVYREEHPADERNKYNYSFVEYERIVE